MGGRARVAILVSALLWVAHGSASADLVAVRALEGPSYGVLTLASTSGERLAQGELVQHLRKENVESRLTFHFQDGSFYDELLVFSQRKVFRLLSYSMTQRGPSFPSSLEVYFDRESGRYHARTRKRDDEKTAEGEVEMPEDLYNGMASLLIRNTDGHATGHHLAFTPKPQLLDLEIKQAGVDRFSIGALERTATRYLVKLEVGGLKGVVAAIMGKTPPDLYYWIANPAPGFLKFEGPMYLHGPVWRVEPAPAPWTKP